MILDSIPPTSNTHKTSSSRQATFNSNSSNKSNKRIYKRRPRNQTLSSIISTRSQRSSRSHKTHRRKNHLPWVLVPLARRTIQATQSIVSIQIPPLVNQFSDDAIDKKLQ